MKQFINRNRFAAQLVVGFLFFLTACYFGFIAVSLFDDIPNGKEILTAIIFAWLAKGAWNIAYEAQDSAWYRRHFEKTGDDFEDRYYRELHG